MADRVGATIGCGGGGRWFIGSSFVLSFASGIFQILEHNAASRTPRGQLEGLREARPMGESCVSLHSGVPVC